MQLVIMSQWAMLYLSNNVLSTKSHKVAVPNNDVIQPSKSNWSSPCILVSKLIDYAHILEKWIPSLKLIPTPFLELMTVLANLEMPSFLEQSDSVDRVVSYFSKKLTECKQNYSSIERECLALLLTSQHFDVYLNVTVHPILVCTDHNPLTFLHKLSNNN